MTVYSSAFFAEVFRGGVLAIQRTHVESARSLGLPPLAFLRKIIAPLALRYALPPYVNVCVMMVKASSILSIISVWELTLAAREIIERTLLVFTVLGIAAGLYFIMCLGVDRLGRQAGAIPDAARVRGRARVISIEGLRKRFPSGLELLRGST